MDWAWLSREGGIIGSGRSHHWGLALVGGPPKEEEFRPMRLGGGLNFWCWEQTKSITCKFFFLPISCLFESIFTEILLYTTYLIIVSSLHDDILFY